MNNLWQFIRKYPLSCLCIALIWYLSIWFLPPELPQLHKVAFIDKWTHFIMYGSTCSVIWWEYIRHHTRLDARRLFLLAWLAPVVMSGVLELIQEYCTATRSGEWLDLAANATGVTIGTVIGLLMYRLKRN
jgi:VanZ family protein